MHPHSTRSLASFRRLAAAVLAAAVSTAPAWAQPDRPLTILVGFPAGGGADFAARVLADKLGPLLGRPVLVDNRPGAGGQIAARLLKGAAPDGATLMLANSHTMATVPVTVRKPGYEVATDFKPVGNFADFETVLLVSAAIDVSNFAELTAWANAQPKPVAVGVPAPASVPEFIAVALGTRWKPGAEPVPYRGTAPMIPDLMSGVVPAGVATSVEAMTHTRAGKVRAVAASHRTPLLPGVPSFAEVGLKGAEATDFLAVWAPAGTPDTVVKTYADAIQKVARMPEVVKKLNDAGQQANFNPPAALAERTRNATGMVIDLVRQTGFKPE